MITITNAFSGKLFCLDRVLESLYRLQIDSGFVRGVLLNNSGDPALTCKLQEFRDSGVWDEVIILTKNPGEFRDVAEVYNCLRPLVKGTWFSVEDDVIPEPDMLRKLLNIAYSYYDIGIVAAYMEARRGWPGPMVWRVGQDTGGLKLDPVGIRGHGVKRVDAVHTGCTVIKQQVYQDYVFHQNGASDRVLGHDIHLCLDAATRGLGTLVSWDVRPGHATTSGILYPEFSAPVLSFLPTLETKSPRVSIITPTHPGRVESLRSLFQDIETQTYPDYEVLVASDGRDPETARLIEGLRDDRIRYWELPHQFGCWGAVARNTLLQKVSGDLVVFCDSDVSIKPQYLETMVSMWRSGYGVGFAQVEFQDQEQLKIIPEGKVLCSRKFHLDSLNGFVDAGVARGFFWDLHEAHDFRYWQQVLDYLGHEYGFRGQVVGSVKRSWGKARDDNDPGISGKLREKSINLDPMGLVRMILDGAREASPEHEAIIAQDPQASIMYCLNVLGGKRFRAGEPSIAQNLQTSLFYLKMVLKGERFVEAEPLFGTTPETAVQYAEQVGQSWASMGKSEVEQVIKSDPELASAYLARWT